MGGGEVKISQLCPGRIRWCVPGSGPCREGSGGGEVVVDMIAPSSASAASGIKSYQGSSLEWPLEVEVRVPSGLVGRRSLVEAKAEGTMKERELLPVPYPDELLDRGGETLRS